MFHLAFSDNSAFNLAEMSCPNPKNLIFPDIWKAPSS